MSGDKRDGLYRGSITCFGTRHASCGENGSDEELTVSARNPVSRRVATRSARWDTEAQKTMVKPRKRAEPAKAASPARGEEADEATIVRPRTSGVPAFSVEVRRVSAEGETTSSDTRPFFKDEISIGRGSSQMSVDLKLEGDMEVSRQHATLKKNGDGGYIITCKGANPILLDGGREVAANESGSVKPGDKIVICSFELIIVG